MKLDGLDHPKTLDLSARLDISLPQTIGHLELLWAFVAQKTPRGNIGKWPDGTIARAAHWTDDPTAFVTALAEAGFLDPCDENRYVVHDWREHCPRWVTSKLTRSGDSFAQPECSAECSADCTQDNTDDSLRARSPSHAMPSQAKKGAPAKSERSAPHKIPDDWQPNETNRQWLREAGMTPDEQAEVIDEFRRWAKNSNHRKANWDLAFSRNPAVKSAVGRRKTNGKAGSRDRPKSATQRSREGAERYLRQQGLGE